VTISQSTDKSWLQLSASTTTAVQSKLQAPVGCDRKRTCFWQEPDRMIAKQDHSSFWRYTSSSMAMEVVALRDIRAGEEVTHSCEACPLIPPEQHTCLR
jgi:hypothetical protein